MAVDERPERVIWSALHRGIGKEPQEGKMFLRQTAHPEGVRNLKSSFFDKPKHHHIQWFKVRRELRGNAPSALYFRRKLSEISRKERNAPIDLACRFSLKHQPFSRIFAHTKTF